MARHIISTWPSIKTLDRFVSLETKVKNYPSLILPRLYLGNVENACDISLLRELKITHILNASTEYINFWESGELEKLFSNVFNEEFIGKEKIESIKLKSLDLRNSNDICKKIKYLSIPLIDVPTQIISQDMLNNSFNFIYQALSDESNCILIHCKHGISRSAALLVYFLIRSFEWSADYAVSYIKDKRSRININKGFMEQLKKI
jgi:protein-tyrosine phosphatase